MHEMRLHPPADHRDPARAWHITPRAAKTALCGATVSTHADDTAADTGSLDDDAPPCAACLHAYRRQIDATARTSTAPTPATTPSRRQPGR